MKKRKHARMHKHSTYAQKHAHRLVGQPKRRLLSPIGLVFALSIGAVCGYVYLYATRAASIVYDVPVGIKSDCSTNVSGSINNWILSVPDGSTLKFNGGCYRTDQTINIYKKNNLTINGGGATFKNIDPTGNSSTADNPDLAARNRCAWQVRASNNIDISNINIIGANPWSNGDNSSNYVSGLEAQHAFNIDGNGTGNTNSNISLHSVHGSYTYGDGVYVRLSDNTHIYNSTFDHVGRQGIAITEGGPVIIENNNIGNNSRSTLDFEPLSDSDTVHDVTVRNNTFGSSRLNFIAAHGRGRVDNITISGNTNSDSMTIDVEGSAAVRRKNWTVVNNKSTHTWGSASGGVFRFVYVDGVNIAFNTQPLQKNRGNYGVRIQNSSDVSVVANSFVDAADAVGAIATIPNLIACGNQIIDGGPFNNPTVCATSPVTSIISPAANDIVSGNVTVTASASDDTAVTRVELYIDGKLAGTDVAPPYNFAWDSKAYGNGKHTLQSKAYDDSGHLGSSNEISVIVNNPQSYLRGDLDKNGHVNGYDLSILLSNYGKENQTANNGDLDGDGVVNGFDVSILLTDYGK